jgi:ABC-type multidrug transport system fused ATPase/permease subunit
LIIDFIAASDKWSLDIWLALAMFAAMMLTEGALWRIAGWSGSEMVVGAATSIRLELFTKLAAQSTAYFTQQFSGSLGNRMTAYANAVKGISSALIWRVPPPSTNL